MKTSGYGPSGIGKLAGSNGVVCAGSGVTFVPGGGGGGRGHIEISGEAPAAVMVDLTTPRGGGAYNQDAFTKAEWAQITTDQRLERIETLLSRIAAHLGLE